MRTCGGDGARETEREKEMLSASAAGRQTRPAARRARGPLYFLGRALALRVIYEPFPKCRVQSLTFFFVAARIERKTRRPCSSRPATRARAPAGINADILFMRPPCTKKRKREARMGKEKTSTANV